MRINTIMQKCVTVVCLSMVAAGLTRAGESEKGPPIRFQSLVAAPDIEAARVDAVGKAVGFQKWPQTEVRHVAPKIEKSLLLHPELVTRELTSYILAPLSQGAWGRGEWSWDRTVETKQPLPTELPPDRKKRLLKSLSPEKRKDPVFVARYLKRKLDSYRKSKRYRFEGQMYVRVCVARNSRAAQEYLLMTMMANTLLTEALVSTYGLAKRPLGAGTISFFTENRRKDNTRVLFVRGNICVDIRGRGCFAKEALPLARKINSMLTKQPPLTHQQLLDRRPAVTISPNVDKAMTKGQRTVSYEISAPADQKIVSLRAFVDGRLLDAKDGKIYLAREKGNVKVKLTAITSELLANSFERELIVDK